MCEENEFLSGHNSLAEYCMENIPTIPKYNLDIPRFANGKSCCHKQNNFSKWFFGKPNEWIICNQ